MKLTYIKTQNLLTDTRTIIETAKQTAYRSVNNCGRGESTIFFVDMDTLPYTATSRR